MKFTEKQPIKSNQARSIIMRKTIVSSVVFASMFVVGPVPIAQAGQCSNASLKGAYGFLDSHMLVPAGTPLSSVGRWNFDGKGNFTNAVTLNDNGTVTHLNDFGTYTLNAHCTCTMGILGCSVTSQLVFWDRVTYVNRS